MSIPNRADRALIKIKTADGPPAVFTTICGVDDVTINENVQTSEDFLRDCEAIMLPGGRKLTNTGFSWSLACAGNDNVDIYATLNSARGVRKVYQVLLYKDDGTNMGDLMGTIEGTAMLTQRTRAFTGTESGTLQLTLEGEGIPTWTPA